MLNICNKYNNLNQINNYHFQSIQLSNHFYKVRIYIDFYKHIILNPFLYFDTASHAFPFGNNEFSAYPIDDNFPNN